MTRRLAAVAIGLLSVAVPAAAGLHQPHAGRVEVAGDWACVSSQEIDDGVCLSNPLPSRLPIPDRP